MSTSTRAVPLHRCVFTDSRYRADPYVVFAELRREQPVTRTRVRSGAEVFLVTRFADAEAALKDPRLIKDIANARDRPPGLLARLGLAHYFANTNMLPADPPDHTRLRAPVQQAFTPRLVSQMREHIQTLADQLITNVQPGGRMDLIDDFALPLSMTVICELLGLPQRAEKKFRRWSSALMASGALSNESVPLVPQFLLMLLYLRGHVRQRRANWHAGDDLISQLVAPRAGGPPLSELELVSTVALLLIAGHETTVNLIGNGMLALLLNPDQLHHLQQHPSLIPGAVEELLRFVNPVQMVNRYAREDLEIGGVPIPRGSHVQIVLAAADHDSAFVPNADRLDVTRPVRQHVAFGQGMHYCLGAALARLEGDIAFATLLRRLPNLRLAIPSGEVRWQPGVEVRGLESLPVLF